MLSGMLLKLCKLMLPCAFEFSICSVILGELESSQLNSLRPFYPLPEIAFPKLVNRYTCTPCHA